MTKTEVNSHIKPKQAKIVTNYGLFIAFSMSLIILIFAEIENLISIPLALILLIAAIYTLRRIDFYKTIEIHFNKDKVTVLKREKKLFAKLHTSKTIKEFQLSETNIALETIKRGKEEVIVLKLKDKTKHHTITSFSYDKEVIKTMHGMIAV